MARSKKDGRQGAGHRLERKWKRTSARRVGQRNRRRQVDLELMESHAEQVALDMELRQEFHAEMESEDWFADYLDWSMPESYPIDEDLESFYWEGSLHGDEYQEYRYMQGHYSYPEDKYSGEPEPSFTVFLAVDRAVRRHGITKIREQAYILAAALDVSVYEILNCISHTRAGYINSWV